MPEDNTPSGLRAPHLSASAGVRYVDGAEEIAKAGAARHRRGVTSDTTPPARSPRLLDP